MIEGTWGAQFHDRVAPLASEAVVTKRGMSAFSASDLDQILRTGRIGTLLLAGVATNFASRALPVRLATWVSKR